VFYIGNSEKKKRRRKLQVSGQKTVVINPSIPGFINVARLYDDGVE